MDKLNGIKIVDYFNTDQETIIKFYERDLEKILEAFKPVTKGKDIKPRNKHKSRVKKDKDNIVMDNQIT